MSHRLRDAAVVWTLRAAAVIAAAVLGLVVLFLMRESVPALRTVGALRFLTDQSWHPTSGTFGFAPMIAGTLLASGGAMLLAGSVGILSAIFQEFYAPRRTAAAYRHLLSLLAGIPSVVFGFWGLVVLAPIIGRIHPPGPSLLAAVLVLALMVLPTVALLAEASLGAVPRDQLLGASALGLSRWSVATLVALPAARRGILAALVLAAGRAVGETMAVLMVSGNVVQWPSSVFDPVRTLTANIALEMSYALGTHRSALFVSGLALTVMVTILVGAAEVVARAPSHAVERGG